MFRLSPVTYHLSNVTCHLSVTTKATATDPPFIILARTSIAQKKILFGKVKVVSPLIEWELSKAEFEFVSDTSEEWWTVARMVSK